MAYEYSEVKVKKLQEIISVESSARSGETIELNIVSWNDRKGRLEIRRWSESGSRAGKGIIFYSKQELIDLIERLSDQLEEIEELEI